MRSGTGLRASPDRRAAETRLGLASLILLYGASAAVLAAVVRVDRRRVSLLVAILLSVLPLTYTALGFLPQRALAPTPLLSGVAPWADPELMAAVALDASAPNGVLLDPVSQTIPWSRAARDDLLLNPAQGAGAALLGNGQSAVLFPTEAASHLLAPFRAVTYSQAARLLLAAWGMFVLVRIAGFSAVAASASAAIFVGSGFMQLWRLHAHSLTAATAPWIVAAAIAFYRDPRPRSAAFLAVAGAVGVAAGHPETLLHVVLFAAVAVPLLARLDGDRPHAIATAAAAAATDDPARPTRRWRRLLGWSGAAALLSFLLAAPVLLPLLETLRVSTEWTERRPLGRNSVETSLGDALDRLRPAGALFAWGDPVAGTWRGPENLAELGGGATGGAALLLAVLGLAGGRTRRILPIALVGLLGLLIGAHTPILSVLFGSVPILGDTLLKRLSLWWVLAVALVAAEGVEILLDRTSRASRRIAWSAAAAALAVAAIIALAGSGAPREETARIWAWEGGPVLAVAAAAAAVLWMRGKRGAGERDPVTALIGTALLLGTLVAPRVELFRSWIPVTPPEGFYPGTAALNVVVNRLRELAPSGFRVAGTEGSLVPHSAAFFGLEEIRAYDPMTFADYDRFLSSVGQPSHPGWVRLLDPGTPALAFLGVRFVFESSIGVAPGDPCPHGTVSIGTDRRRCRFRHPGLALAYAGADAVVWERVDALPRAFFPLAWRAIQDVEAATATATQIDDFARLAIVDRGPSEAAADGVTENAPGLVERLEVGGRSIEAEVSTPAPSILATSQPAIPGWRLLLDGSRAPELVRRVNGAFLGVAVPAGRHRVQLRYAPLTWSAGLLLAACGAAASALLILADRHGRGAVRGRRA